MPQWNALPEALRGRGDSVRFMWTELDALVGGLPASATDHRAWWSGDRPHVRAWRSAGYELGTLRPGVDVVFVRTGSGPPAAPPSPATNADLLLLACVKEKLDRPAAARDLYASPLFRKERAYAERLGVPWYILSGEHGLVAPEEWLAPYERYLPDTPPTYRAAWGAWVAERLDLLAGPLRGKVIEIHAGAAYVAAVERHLVAKGATILQPLRGLAMGERLAWYTPEVGTSFVERLRAFDDAVTPGEFLAAEGRGTRTPGLYSWWVDEAGAADLSAGLGLPLPPGLIYAGLAGATRWPSGKRSANTLWSRIAGMHLGGSHEFSTFRRTLGAILAATTGTGRVDETALSGWMHAHLKVVAVPSEDADTLGRLEADVLRQMDPPLNLQGMPVTGLRQRVSELRRRVR